MGLFTTYDFGSPDAEDELNRGRRHLLETGFTEPWPLSRLFAGRKWLILGYKGSGKSAVLCHLMLKEDELGIRVRRVKLGREFSFQELTGLAGEGEATPVRYPSYWTFLLLLQLYTSYSSDEEALSAATPDFRATIKLLSELQLLVGGHLDRTVQAVSEKRAITIRPPWILEAGLERTVQLGGVPLQSAVIETLVDQAATFKAGRTHVIAIDALDGLLHGDVPFAALRALFHAVKDLNNRFYREGSPALFLVACRTELFGRLQSRSSDLNQVKGASQVSLQWVPEGDDDWFDSRLVKLVEKKARATHRKVDVWSFFQQTLESSSGRKRPTIQVLFEYTRHTPRDLLQLLTYIQNHCDRYPQYHKYDVIPSAAIKSAVREYGKEYFEDELKNELSGLLANDDEAEDFLRFVSSLSRNQFDLGALQSRKDASPYYKAINVEDGIRQLFEAGGVANVLKDGPNGDNRVRFMHRSRADFNEREPIMLHPALYQAWKPRWSKSGGL